MKAEEKESCAVLYIPGWLRDGRDPYIREFLTDIFPDSEFEVHSWDNHRPWKVSMRNADGESSVLADALAALPGEKRERMILVGHSLGGRICVRTLARLGERGMRVKRAILLAAAIPDDDPDIGKAVSGSVEPILNLCNPDDTVLKYCYGLFGEEMRPPLGVNGLMRRTPRWIDFMTPSDLTERTVLFDGFDGLNREFIKRTANHHVRFYLTYLQELAEKDFAEEDPPLTVPQDKPNLEFPVTDGRIFWTCLNASGGWSLQRNDVTGFCRILDNRGRRRAWGSENRMRDSFERVRAQLESPKKTDE